MSRDRLFVFKMKSSGFALALALVVGFAAGDIATAAPVAKAVDTSQSATLAEKAQQLFEQGKVYAALEQVNLLVPILREAPNSVPARWLICAKVLHRTNHLDRCLECYGAYLKASPDNDERQKYEALAGVIRGQVQTERSRKDRSALVAPAGASDAVDYFSYAISDGLYRWPRERFPLGVYFAPATSIPTYKPEYEEAVRQGLDEWDNFWKRKWKGGMNDTEGRLFKFVDNEADCDVLVSFVDDLHAPALQAEAGKTQVDGNMQGVNKATILLLTVSPFQDQRMTRDFMRMIAVHEAGHALGLVGHSPYEDDVMFPSLSNQRGISGRDVATLDKLYESGSADSEALLQTLPLKGKVQLLFATASKDLAKGDRAAAIGRYLQVLSLAPDNRNVRPFLACELNNAGMAKRDEVKAALKYFRWASYFQPEEAVFVTNISSCLENMRLDSNSAAVRSKQADECATALDFRGAVVETRAAIRLQGDAVLKAKLEAKLKSFEKSAVEQPLNVD